MITYLAARHSVSIESAGVAATALNTERLGRSSSLPQGCSRVQRVEMLHRLACHTGSYPTLTVILIRPQRSPAWVASETSISFLGATPAVLHLQLPQRSAHLQFQQQTTVNTHPFSSLAHPPFVRRPAPQADVSVYLPGILGQLYDNGGLSEINPAAKSLEDLYDANPKGYHSLQHIPFVSSALVDAQFALRHSSSSPVLSAAASDIFGST